MEDDDVDGCDHVLEDNSVTPDKDLDGIVLFADIKPGLLRPLRVARRKREWQEVFRDA